MNGVMSSDARMQTIHGSPRPEVGSRGVGPATAAGINHDIGPEELAGLDLNLVVAFDAMARELSVTAAAARVGVTQSAMSHALRRLRELLGDALLVRGKSGMMLTPRAEALVVPLRSGLVTLGRALRAPASFEPSTARRAFIVASPDLFDVLVIPAVLERMRREAPGIDLTVLPIAGPRLAERLETGELDAAILPQMDEAKAPRPALAAPGIVRRMLFRDEFVCFLRADHPVLRAKPAAQNGKKRDAAGSGELALKSYAELSHVLIAAGEGPSVVDELLAQKGLSRRVALRIPHFYSALSIVAKSDLILTAPTFLAQVAVPGDRVVTRTPPLRIPTHSVNLVWHERFSNDPGQEWLRALISDTAKAIVVPASRARTR